MQAIFMANAGGAIDNAKKKIEEEGGSGTPEHICITDNTEKKILDVFKFDFDMESK